MDHACPAWTLRAAWLSVAAVLALGVAGPLAARESLGLYREWGVFRDPALPRCYAIAMTLPSTMQRDYQPFATVGTWPKRRIFGQVHFRMSRKLAPDPRLKLTIGDKAFALTGGGGDAWAADARMNAAITSAMRSATSMTVSATDANGKRFSNTWRLPGAASAMDAAAIGCARAR
jgi:hypothetical protein